jgi:hypothetical protein
LISAKNGRERRKAFSQNGLDFEKQNTSTNKNANFTLAIQESGESNPANRWLCTAPGGNPDILGALVQDVAKTSREKCCRFRRNSKRRKALK